MQSDKDKRFNNHEWVVHTYFQTENCHFLRLNLFSFTDTADVIQRLLRLDRFTNLFLVFKFYHDYSHEVVNLPEVQSIIHSQNNYDLVMAELFFMDVFFAFGYKFKAPVVALSPMNLMFFYSWTLGNPYPSSYVPNQLLWYTENMPLFSRISNTVFNFFSGERKHGLLGLEINTKRF